MKVVAFNGSPREHGNTQELIKIVLSCLEEDGIETKLINVGKKQLQGCVACFKCRENKNKKCAMTMDRLNEYIEEMLDADGIILASPVYFANVTAQLKALIDRSGLVAKVNDDMFKGKVGAGVVAVRRGGAVYAFSAINHFFLINQMNIPGSSYWNDGVGFVPGDVKNDDEGIRTMRNLAKNMAELLKSISKVV